MIASNEVPLKDLMRSQHQNYSCFKLSSYQLVKDSFYKWYQNDDVMLLKYIYKENKHIIFEIIYEIDNGLNYPDTILSIINKFFNADI